MKRLIRRRWSAASTLITACIVAGAFLGASFGQTRQRGEDLRGATREPRPRYEELGSGQMHQMAEAMREGTRKPRSRYEEMDAFGGMGAEPRKNWESSPEDEDSESSDEYQAPTRQELASEELMYAMKETRQLIKAYRQTDDEDEKAAIAKGVPDAVAKEFDFRQQLRKVELEDLAQQLRHLQELHQRRAKQRNQIIEQRVHQLLQDADGLSWGSDDELQPSAGSGRKGS